MAWVFCGRKIGRRAKVIIPSVIQCGIVFLLVAGMGVGCARSRKTVKYKPAETLLEILSDFQRHWEDDTYRFHAARDLKGRNLYKVTLIRLSNYEKVYPHRFQEIIRFNKAKAYERLRAYRLAIESYQNLVEKDTPLAEGATKSLAVCQEFQALSRPIQGDGSVDSYLAAFEERIQAWEGMVRKYQTSVYEYLAREEQEEVEWARVKWIEENRKGLENGTDRVIGGYQLLLNRYSESKNVHYYILRFADFYSDLAREYAEERNPSGLDFDLKEFEKYVDIAVDLCGSVAGKDGIQEKLEAKGKQEALIAYANLIRKLSQ